MVNRRKCRDIISSPVSKTSANQLLDPSHIGFRNIISSPVSKTSAIQLLDQSHTRDFRPRRHYIGTTVEPSSSSIPLSNQQQRQSLLASPDGSTVEGAPLDRTKVTSQSKVQNPRAPIATLATSRRLKAQRKGESHSLSFQSHPVSSSSPDVVVLPRTKRPKSKGPLISRICGASTTPVHPHPRHDCAIAGGLNPGLFLDDKENVRNHATSGRTPLPPASEDGPDVEEGANASPPACNGARKAENARRQERLLAQADEFLDDLLTECISPGVTLKSVVGPGFSSLAEWDRFKDNLIWLYARGVPATYLVDLGVSRESLLRASLQLGLTFPLHIHDRETCKRITKQWPPGSFRCQPCSGSL